MVQSWLFTGQWHSLQTTNLKMRPNHDHMQLMNLQLCSTASFEILFSPNVNRIDSFLYLWFSANGPCIWRLPSCFLSWCTLIFTAFTNEPNNLFGLVRQPYPAIPRFSYELLTDTRLPEEHFPELNKRFVFLKTHPTSYTSLPNIHLMVWFSGTDVRQIRLSFPGSHDGMAADCPNSASLSVYLTKAIKFFTEAQTSVKLDPKNASER